MTLLEQNCRCEPNKLQGVSNELYHAVGGSGWTVGTDRASSAAREEERECWTTRTAQSTSGERDLVCLEKWLSVERCEEGMVWCQQQPARGVSNLERSRFVEEDLSSDGEVLS